MFRTDIPPLSSPQASSRVPCRTTPPRRCGTAAPTRPLALPWPEWAPRWDRTREPGRFFLGLLELGSFFGDEVEVSAEDPAGHQRTSCRRPMPAEDRLAPLFLTYPDDHDDGGEEDGGNPCSDEDPDSCHGGSPFQPGQRLALGVRLAPFGDFRAVCGWRQRRVLGWSNRSLLAQGPDLVGQDLPAHLLEPSQHLVQFHADSTEDRTQQLDPTIWAIGSISTASAVLANPPGPAVGAVGTVWERIGRCLIRCGDRSPRTCARRSSPASLGVTTG